MRDKIKSTDYFLGRYKKIDVLIEISKEKLRAGEIDDSQIGQCKFHIFERRYQQLLVLYSMGKSLNLLENELVLLSELIPEFWEPNVGKAKVRKEGLLDEYLLTHYKIVLGLMALSILTRNDFVLDKLKDLIKRDNIRDELYDYFLSKGSLDSIKPPYIFDKKMTRIKNVHKTLKATLFIQNKVKQTQLVDKYLNKQFYKENGPVYGYDTHISKLNNYNGYWSFESGALAVLLDIDTETLRKSDYFPVDLVDNYRSNIKDVPDYS